MNTVKSSVLRGRNFAVKDPENTVHNANEQSKSESPEAPEKHVGENAVDAASEVDKSDEKQLPAINGVVDEAATNGSSYEHCIKF
ncbi:unnamed protein product [Anisakis simplex]|uniref:Ovule protein n=1 Tax=Anisakis simplex TaxID=6269 RepID=A0A0M3JJB6_ANISI|nr:unnamed protein product [Anisakis simplex]